MSGQRTADWPAGVIARYLTAAGVALADPSIVVDLYESPTGDIDGVCRGCESTFTDAAYIQRDLDSGRHWAQEHAESCRALPKRAHRAGGAR